MRRPFANITLLVLALDVLGGKGARMNETEERDWRKIAEEVNQESDPNKLTDLMQELLKALQRDEQKEISEHLENDRTGQEADIRFVFDQGGRGEEETKKATRRRRKDHQVAGRRPTREGAD